VFIVVQAFYKAKSLSLVSSETTFPSTLSLTSVNAWLSIFLTLLVCWQSLQLQGTTMTSKLCRKSLKCLARLELSHT